MRGQAPETESALVRFDSRAVELDCFFDGIGADGDETLLIGEAKQKHVRHDRVAE